MASIPPLSATRFLETSLYKISAAGPSSGSFASFITQPSPTAPYSNSSAAIPLNTSPLELSNTWMVAVASDLGMPALSDGLYDGASMFSK